MKNNTNLILLIVILILSVYVLFSEKKNENILMNILQTQMNNYQPRNKNVVDETWKNAPLDITPAEAYDTSLVLGNKADLDTFSIYPNSKVSGPMIVQGIVKNGYFFEGNILINILDKNKKVLKVSHANAMGEWMTINPVEFQGNLDFTGLVKGPGFIEIHNDNASGEPKNDKSILIPIVIE